MKQHRWLTYTLIALLLVSALGIAMARQAEAGPEIVGNPDGAETRALITDGESVRRIVYFAAGSKTMVGANTPVASDPECGLFGNLHKAEVQLTGGMGGTNPTLAIKWQNSIDGGTTWKAYLKSDGSINGATLYAEGDIAAKAGFMYRLKVPTADFVAGTSLTGRFA